MLSKIVILMAAKWRDQSSGKDITFNLFVPALTIRKTHEWVRLTTGGESFCPNKPRIVARSVKIFTIVGIQLFIEYSVGNLSR